MSTITQETAPPAAPPDPGPPRRPRRRRGVLGATAAAVLVLAGICFPIYWMGVVSLREDVYLYPVRLLPSGLSLSAYGALLSDFPFLRWIANTAFVAIGSTVVVMVLAVPCAYGLSRFRMRGKIGFDLFILSSQMLPVSLLIIPFYVTWKQLGLLDSLTGLLLANMALILPIAIWMLRGFFDAVPVEVEEAARVDGCNRLQAIWHVTLPTALPGVVAAAAFCFVEAWTEYLFAITLVTSSEDMVVSGGLAKEMFEEARIRWNVLMAGSVLATIPVAALIVPLQRQIVRGLTAGAVKG